MWCIRFVYTVESVAHEHVSEYLIPSRTLALLCLSDQNASSNNRHSFVEMVLQVAAMSNSRTGYKFIIN